MRGTALASFDKQFPFDQIKEVSIRGVVSHVESLATPTAGDPAFTVTLRSCFRHASVVTPLRLQRFQESSADLP